MSESNEQIQTEKGTNSMVLELRGPVVMSLEITTLCNGRCPGCSNVFPHRPDDKSLTAAQWGEVIKKLSPFVQEFRITGGEPTERGDLFEILSVLEEQERYYHIFTNGLWRDPVALAEKFQSCAYLGSFLVSLHGSDAETHRSFSGAENFASVTETVKTLVSSGFEVNTNSVLTKENINRIEEIVFLSVELGAKSIVFNRFIGKPVPSITLSEEETKEALTRIEKLQKQGYNCIIGNCIPFCFFPSSSSGCLAGVTYGTVDPFGNVRPCNHSPYIAGNLVTDSVTSVWQSKKMRAWREKIPKECTKCAKLSFCPAGCKAMADLLGAQQDSLIKTRVKPGQENEKILEVSLDETLCPSPKYLMREEDFGLALVRHTQVIPVSFKARKIIDMINGSTTLGEIEKKHGGAALSFVYSLYIRNFIDFIPKG